jgi:hypothetical protein
VGFLYFLKYDKKSLDESKIEAEFFVMKYSYKICLKIYADDKVKKLTDMFYNALILFGDNSSIYRERAA